MSLRKKYYTIFKYCKYILIYIFIYNFYKIQFILFKVETSYNKQITYETKLQFSKI